MDYQQSRAYVKDAEQYAGGALDLTNIKELMNRLGNPQDRLKIRTRGRNQRQGFGDRLSVHDADEMPDIVSDGISLLRCIRIGEKMEAGWQGRSAGKRLPRQIDEGCRSD